VRRKAMAKEEKDNIVVGLDIGTTKICCIIGEMNPDNTLNVIGIGQTPSKGVRKGIISDIEVTIEGIKKAVYDASRMAGVEVAAVYAGITGDHVKGINLESMVAIAGKNKQVEQSDIDRVREAIRLNAATQNDREVLHIIPQEYIVDDQSEIKNPLGMYGSRLRSRVHFITASVPRVQDIVRSIEKAGFFFQGLVLQPLASAEACLTYDEKELGVVLVDIGGGTTDMIVYIDGGVRHTAIFPVGGIQVTNDLAIGLRAPIEQVEEIKKTDGCAFAPIVNELEEVKVNLIGKKTERIVPRRVVAEIIQPRMEEIFGFVLKELKASGMEGRVAAGCVVTGGGSLISGIEEVADKVLRLHARVGYPSGISGLLEDVNSPVYSTAIGLMVYGARNRASAKSSRQSSGGTGIEGMIKKFKGWLDIGF